MTAVAAPAIVTAPAVLPLDRVAVNDAAARAPVTAIAAYCPMYLFPNPDGSGSTAATATATARAEKIQALKTEYPSAAAPPAAPTIMAETVGGIPWPCEDFRFGDAP